MKFINVKWYLHKFYISNYIYTARIYILPSMKISVSMQIVGHLHFRHNTLISSNREYFAASTKQNHGEWQFPCGAHKYASVYDAILIVNLTLYFLEFILCGKQLTMRNIESQLKVMIKIWIWSKCFILYSKKKIQC